MREVGLRALPINLPAYPPISISKLVLGKLEEAERYGLEALRLAETETAARPGITCVAKDTDTYRAISIINPVTPSLPPISSLIRCKEPTSPAPTMANYPG